MKTKNVRTTWAALLSAVLLTVPATSWGQATQYGMRVVSKTDVTKVNTTEITADGQVLGVDDNSTVNVTVADKTAEGKVAKVTVTKVTDLAASTVTVSGANTIDYNASTTLTLTADPTYADGAVSWRFEAQSENDSNGSVEFSSQTALSATNGQATVSVKGTGAGKVDIYANVGSVESAAYTITINKIDDPATLSASSVGFGTTTSNKTVTVSGNTGTVSASVPSGSGCAVSVSGNTITITRNSNLAFSATITVTIAESTNYNSTTKTIDVSGTALNPLASVTTAHLGYYVCTDGYYYHPNTAVPSGKTVAGMIAYVSSQGHGLILAKSDANSGNNGAWSTINTACSSYTPVITAGGTTLTWHLPSQGEWVNMGATSNNWSALSSRLSALSLRGISTVQSGEYWSSTYDNSLKVYYPYDFNGSKWTYKTPSTNCYGRACASF